MAKRMLYLFWLPIILAIIGVVSAIVVAIISNPIPGPSPTSTTLSSNNFAYQVRVETKEGKAISNCAVILEIGGKAPLDSVSDANGLAQIFVEASYAGKPGKLIVKIDGYKTHTQFINLTEGALPKVVQLDPVP